jgi:hypothetical protein
MTNAIAASLNFGLMLLVLVCDQTSRAGRAYSDIADKPDKMPTENPVSLVQNPVKSDLSDPEHAQDWQLPFEQASSRKPQGLDSTESKFVSKQDFRPDQNKQDRRMILIAFAISGAIAMVNEVAWTRALLMIIGSTTFGDVVHISIGNFYRWNSGIAFCRPSSPSLFFVCLAANSVGRRTNSLSLFVQLFAVLEPGFE